MIVAVIKTGAEQGFAQTFEQIAQQLPGNDAARAARREAIDAFNRLGLPHRRIEAWKYTDLRTAVKEALPVAIGDRTKLTIADVIVALGPLAALDVCRIVLVNGAFRPELSTRDIPVGLTIRPLADALASGDSSLTAEAGGHEARADDAVVALNTAYATDGAIIEVAAGARINKPVLLAHVRAGAERRFAAVRNIVRVGKAATATLIETYATLPGTAEDGQTNVLTDTVLADEAHFTHLKCAMETGNVTHLATWQTTLATDTVYRAFQLTAGPQLARNQSFIAFAGTGGKLDCSGVFLARDNRHIDTTMVIDHAVPHCESRELFKGVLDDAARGVFQGKVIVRPDAQKTDGKQMAQAMMLSPDAEFDSKPELEIYADDVVCGHGTTSAEIDEDLLFYCRSRGIPESEARALLIEAFVGEAIDKIEDEDVRQAFATVTRTWLTSAR